MILGRDPLGQSPLGAITADETGTPAVEAIAAISGPLGTPSVVADPGIDVHISITGPLGTGAVLGEVIQLQLGRLAITGPLGRASITADSGTGPDASDVAVVFGEITLAHASGSTVPLAASLSIDQDSPVWLADITLADLPDYQAIAIGDDLTLSLYGTEYALVCDGKTMTRDDIAPGLTLKAVSPVARLGSSFAVPTTLGAISTARATVERTLSQAVDWQIVDWALPVTAESLEATPLDLARQIVAAAGGVLESRPDGSLVARPRYPVGIPDYATATVIALTDADLLGQQDSLDPSLRYDRWVIIGEDLTQSAIQIESAMEGEDPTTHRIRVYPWPWRSVTLAHTGDENTYLSSVGLVTETHEELIEIRAGTGSVSYPVTTLTSSGYQHVDLGAVTTDGTSITTAVAGYSLLRITYQARAWHWLVSNAQSETIQFLAME